MSAAIASWRDRVKVHPAAELFPMMSVGELDDLAKDIAEHWLQQPLVFWTDKPLGRVGRNGPKEVFLLDGRNRLEAIERAFADDIPRQQEALENAIYLGRGGAARLLYGNDDPWAFVVSANLHRRHLTAEKKRELIVALLRAKPERSDRQTAKIAGADHKTVAGVRGEAERRGEIPHVSTRTDTAGRQQPAHKPPPSAVVHRSSLPPPPPPPSKEQQPRALREQQASRAAEPTALPDEAMDVFDALVRRLIDERRDILLHVPFDRLAKTVLAIMAQFGVSIELLEEVAAER